MRKILTSFLTVFTMIALVAGASQAVFSDTETSTGNTFSAGTLDLTIDGGNENVQKFAVTNMRPGNQPKGTYMFTNVGSIGGKLNLKNIAVTNTENGCVEPEEEAGDNTCGDSGVGKGELGSVVNVRLFVDKNGDGWIGAGEPVFYNGKVSELPTYLDINEPMPSSATTYITALFDWWNTPDDNKAQGDSMAIDFTFELTQ